MAKRLVRCFFAFIIMIPLVAFLAMPAQIFAQTPDPVKDLCDGQACHIDPPIGDISLEPEGLVNKVVTISITLSGALALILIIYGGFKLVTSAGNPAEIKKGKDIIYYAIVGLLLILFAVTVVKFIGGGVLQLPVIG